MALTIKDIGRLCGVSIGTVDRALNGRPGVNAETKARVLAVARQVGYRPHLPARSLVTGKTMTVGVVVFNLRNYFFSQLITSIDRFLRGHDYSVYPAFTERDLDNERECLTRLCSMNVDGIVLFPVGRGAEYERFLRSLGAPIVSVGNRISKAWPFAGIDDQSAEMDAVKFIADKGYEEAVFVGPPLSDGARQNVYEVEQRYLGFSQGAREHLRAGRPRLVQSAGYLEEAAELARQATRRTAFLCSSDIYALRVLKAFRERGIRVPEDAGLMGFDNIDVLEFIRPRLATVDYHIAGIGEAAATTLLALMRAEEEAQRRVSLITHAIVPGESV